MITGPSYVPADTNLGKRPVLSEADVRQIVAARARRVNAMALAQIYGVSTRTIYRAARPQYLRHCPTCGHRL
jgi:hypothetical protein